MLKSMKFKDVMNEIHKISKIKDPQKARYEIKKLDQEINKPKIRIRTRGKYIYSYKMEIYYNPEVKEKRERVIENLGRILIEDYAQNQELIEKLRKKSNIQELKKYFEEY